MNNTNERRDDSIARPPLRINERHEVLILDRDLARATDGYLYMAAAPYKEVRFGICSTQSKMRETSDEPGYEGKAIEVLEDTIPKTPDLLYGISFPLSVLNFRFWIEHRNPEEEKKKPAEVEKEVAVPEAKQINIIDLRRTSKAVKEVRFENPIVLLNPYFNFKISYVPNPREFLGGIVRFDYDDGNNRHLFNARFVVGLLDNDIRNNRRDEMVARRYVPLDGTQTDPQPVDKNAPIEDRKPQYKIIESWIPISIKPTVILRDESVYDRNVIDIDLENFSIRH